MLDFFPRDAETESEECLESADEWEPSVHGHPPKSIHPVWHPPNPVEGMDELIDAEVAEDEREADREGETGVLGGGHRLMVAW